MLIRASRMEETGEIFKACIGWIGSARLNHSLDSQAVKAPILSQVLYKC